MATGTIQKNMVLLWTNPDLDADFDAQTINLDLSSYDAVLIRFKVLYGGHTATRVILIDENEKVFDLNMSGSNMRFYHRSCFTSNSGVRFEVGHIRTQGTSGETDSKAVLKPRAIYGIRF